MSLSLNERFARDLFSINPSEDFKKYNITAHDLAKIYGCAIACAVNVGCVFNRVPEFSDIIIMKDTDDDNPDQMDIRKYYKDFMNCLNDDKASWDVTGLIDMMYEYGMIKFEPGVVSSTPSSDTLTFDEIFVKVNEKLTNLIADYITERDLAEFPAFSFPTYAFLTKVIETRDFNDLTNVCDYFDDAVEEFANSNKQMAVFMNSILYKSNGNIFSFEKQEINYFPYIDIESSVGASLANVVKFHILVSAYQETSNGHWEEIGTVPFELLTPSELAPTESEEPADLIQHKLLQIINLSKSRKSSSGKIREF